MLKSKLTLLFTFFNFAILVLLTFLGSSALAAAKKEEPPEIKITLNVFDEEAVCNPPENNGTPIANCILIFGENLHNDEEFQAFFGDSNEPLQVLLAGGLGKTLIVGFPNNELPDPGSYRVLITNIGGSGESYHTIPFLREAKQCPSGEFITGITADGIFTCTDICSEDITPPDIVFPEQGEHTLECPADTSTIGQPTAIDNCTSSGDLQLSTFDQTFSPEGELVAKVIRGWLFSDENGNVSSSVSQTITVLDTKPPILSGVPADTTVACDDIPPAPSVTATDACGIPLGLHLQTVSVVNDDGSGSITRKWEVTDVGGHTVSAQQIVTIEACSP
jgi:hypothetical protein